MRRAPRRERRHRPAPTNSTAGPGAVLTLHGQIGDRHRRRHLRREDVNRGSLTRPRDRRSSSAGSRGADPNSRTLISRRLRGSRLHSRTCAQPRPRRAIGGVGRARTGRTGGPVCVRASQHRRAEQTPHTQGHRQCADPADEQNVTGWGCVLGATPGRDTVGDGSGSRAVVPTPSICRDPVDRRLWVDNIRALFSFARPWTRHCREVSTETVFLFTQFIGLSENP